jgi:hypothetical protein
MSELKTNKISTNDQNNVAIDNALGLKSYTTPQRDALTSGCRWWCRWLYFYSFRRKYRRRLIL